MDKIFKSISKFLKLDFNNLDHINKKIIICDRINADSSFKFLIISYFLSKKKKIKPSVLFEGKNNQISLKIFKYFGVNEFIFTGKLNFFSSKLLLLIFYFVKAIFQLIFFGFNNFVKSFKIKDIYFGDLVYDQYSRYNYRFSLKNHFNYYFIKILIQSINKFLNIYIYIENNNVEVALIGQHCYCNNSSITSRIAAVKNIKCVLVSGPNLIYYKDKNFAFRYPFQIMKSDIKNLDFKNKKVLKKYKNHLYKRNTGKLYYHHDMINRLVKKKKYSKNQLDNYFNFKNKKIIKIFFPSHVFGDAPHASGKIVFLDYFEHFVKTIEFVKKKKEIALLIKPHPSSYMLDEEGFIEEYFLKNDLKRYDNLKIVPKDVLTESLLSYCDGLSTCCGTAGLEYSAFYGKKPLLAGQSYYSDLGFTLDTRSKEKYFFHLENINKIKNLNKQQIIDAKKTLYLNECVNHWQNFGKIFPEVRINKNKKVITLSDNQYLKSFSKNLNKYNLENDDYILYVKHIINKYL